MNTKELILKSIEPIIASSNSVRIDKVKIKELAGKLANTNVPGWDNTLQFLGSPDETVQYYFFLDSVNFCFWAQKGREKWAYKKDGLWLSGYYAYSYAIKKAFIENPRYFSADYLANVSFSEFKKIFEGKNELLLLEKRHEIIKENFEILNKKFGGQASELITQAKGDVNTLVEILMNNFPTFNDAASVKGNKLYFLKRAQIFVSDIYYAFAGLGLGSFNNLEDLAVFADYKLPQLLEADKVLVYDRSLMDKIKNEELIEAGSKEELEIRATTIYACELLRKELGHMGRELNSNQLDWILWVQAKETKFTLPHHKTISIFY